MGKYEDIRHVTRLGSSYFLPLTLKPSESISLNIRHLRGVRKVEQCKTIAKP
jgi:hypothetical protein